MVSGANILACLLWEACVCLVVGSDDGKPKSYNFGLPSSNGNAEQDKASAAPSQGWDVAFLQARHARD